MIIFLIFSLIFILSFVLAGVIRRYAISNSMIDIPNDRSSHSIPTPRGGGIAIVIAYVIFAGLIQCVVDVDVVGMAVVMVPGLFAAFIGFWDDHGHIEPKWRLAMHFFSAIVCLWLLPRLPLSNIDFVWLDPVLYVLAAFYLVWLLNLYNFMDGIDGIAAMEALTVGLAGGGLWWYTNDSSLALFAVAVAISTLGFLLWNFPKARIFMGDGGSGFLGFILGSFALISGAQDEKLFWAWNILLGVFIVDATLTLIRRMVGGEQFSKAHRTHAYQYAARKFGQHKIVSIAVAMINVFWLLPIACLVVNGVFHGFFGILIGYLPLLVLALYFKAGVKEEIE